MKYYVYTRTSTKPFTYDVHRYDSKGAVQTIVRGLQRHKDAVAVQNALEDETDMVESGQAEELVKANQ
jgi:hypothetical protein